MLEWKSLSEGVFHSLFLEEFGYLLLVLEEV